MRVKYVGPQRSVRVPHVDGREFLVKNGETVDLPSSLAESLLEQETWKKGSGKKEETSDGGGS